MQVMDEIWDFGTFGYTIGRQNERCHLHVLAQIELYSYIIRCMPMQTNANISLHPSSFCVEHVKGLMLNLSKFDATKLDHGKIMVGFRAV